MVGGVKNGSSQHSRAGGKKIKSLSPFWDTQPPNNKANKGLCDIRPRQPMGAPYVCHDSGHSELAKLEILLPQILMWGHHLSK